MASVDNLKKQLDDVLRLIEEKQKKKQQAPLIIVRDGTPDSEIEEAVRSGQSTQNVTIIKTAYADDAI